MTICGSYSSTYPTHPIANWVGWGSSTVLFFFRWLELLLVEPQIELPATLYIVVGSHTTSTYIFETRCFPVDCNLTLENKTFKTKKRERQGISRIYPIHLHNEEFNNEINATECGLVAGRLIWEHMQLVGYS